METEADKQDMRDAEEAVIDAFQKSTKDPALSDVLAYLLSVMECSKATAEMGCEYDLLLLEGVRKTKAVEGHAKVFLRVEHYRKQPDLAKLAKVLKEREEGQ